MAPEHPLEELAPGSQPTPLEEIAALEQELQQQEKTARALVALERDKPGASGQTEQQIRARVEAVQSKRRHLRMLKEGVALDALARPEADPESKFVQATDWMLAEVGNRRDLLDALYELRERMPESERAQKVYDRERDKLLELHERFERLSQNVPADSPVRQPKSDGTENETVLREREIKDIFTDALIKDADRFPAGASYTEPLDSDFVFTPPQVPEPVPAAEPAVEAEPLLSAELYDAEVVKLQAVVAAIESNFDLLARKNMLDEASLGDLHGQLDAAQEKLQELDLKAESPAASRERKSLMFMIDRLRAQYPATMRPVQPAALSAVRAKHAVAAAKYTAIAHRLSEDGRRVMRVRLASLGALVRQAEDEEWRRLHAVATPPPPPEPPAPSDEELKLAIRLAVARASSAAPVIASAVHVPPTKRRRGILGALGDAFRLK